MALKVEDDGISAFKCPVCHTQGRISKLVRLLATFRRSDLEHIALEADKFDLLGSKLPSYDEHFSADEGMPEPIDEAMFDGLFHAIGDHPAAVAFVQKRGLTRATCEKLKLEYDPDKKRIVFPVRNHKGELYGWTGRTILPDYKPKILDYAGLPKSQLILGEERWREGKSKLIVEGLFAYAHVHEIGIEEYCDVGAIMGSSLSDVQAGILMAHGCPVLAMPDPDQPGTQCLYGPWDDDKKDFAGGGLIDKLAGELPVRVPYYPAGVNDIDDITLPDLVRVLANSEMVFPGARPHQGS